MKNICKTLVFGLVLASSGAAFSKPMPTMSRQERMDQALEHYRAKVSHKANYSQFVHCEEVQKNGKRKVKLSCSPVTENM